MRWWVSGAVLLALVVGAAGGYAVATAEDDPTTPGRSTFAEPAPVPADHPRLPVQLYKPDPDDKALEPGIALEQVRLTALNAKGQPSKYSVSVPVPALAGDPQPGDWNQTFTGTSRWQFTVLGNDSMSYGMRIDIVADRGETVARAIDVRRSELRSAAAQGNLKDVEFPEVDDTGFTATYVDRGYRRVSIERFVSGPDGNAFAAITVYGRERDVPGMTDLVALVNAGLDPIQRP